MSAINQVISLFPDDEWIFVGDNLNIHYSDSLVTHIAERLEISGLGVFNKSGILHNVQSRTEFLTEDTHRILFVYTPIHCSWLNQIEIFFRTINTHLLIRGEYKSLEELEESIQKYLVQYNEFWAHPYKWTYNTTLLGD